MGYGFGDEHVNGILAQAIRSRPDKRVVVVSPLSHLGGNSSDGNVIEDQRKLIGSKLELSASQLETVNIVDSKAKDFFENGLSLEEMANLFPNEESPFPDLQEIDATTQAET